MAYTHRQVAGFDRLIVGLRTDIRTAFATAPLNPMIGQALDVLCVATDELMATLTAHLAAKGTRR